MDAFEAPAGITLDLGNLTAFDVRIEEDNPPLVQTATDSTRALVHALFSLPVTDTQDGRCVTLPKGQFHLPRSKPIPKERAQTKWEKFAQEKGIQKKRRDRLVLDDSTGEYVPRYGRGSKNSLDRDVIIPHKQGMGSDFDPFTQKRQEKKKRIKDNRRKNLSNIGRANKTAGLQPMQALDVAKTGPSGKKYLPKRGLKDSLAVAQRSTASAGRFDNRIAKEPKQKVRGRKKKYNTMVGSNASQQEKQRLSKIADSILKK